MSKKTVSDVWLVVEYADYSGSRVFENQAEAEAHAKDRSEAGRKQTAVYGCKLETVMVNQPSIVSRHSSPAGEKP